MQIICLPLLSDNYAWLLHHPEQQDCAVIDPSEGPPVAAAIAARGLRLRWILVTHHHLDHVGGVDHLAVPGVQVVASQVDRSRVPGVTQTVEDGATLEVLGEPVKCLMVPGHTRGAVAYYWPRAQAVFTGDTLFTGGCGRLFEGDPAQMYGSLTKLAALPAATQVYCGHEYTEKNLQFAQSLEPASVSVATRLQEVQERRARGQPTVPELLSVEKHTNPFLRADSQSLAALLQKPTGVATLAELRARRDQF